MAYELITFADIQDSVIEELKLAPNDTTEVNRIKRDINLVYLNSVVPMKRWPWLRGNTQKEHKPYLSNGTVACTPDSTTITFSTAPTTSKAGYLFAIDSFSEIYQISSHTANSTTATLSTPFTGSLQTAATYKVWTDSVVLPTDCRETIEVYHQFFRQPMEAVGLQEYRRRVAEGPFTQGRPEIYSTYDFVGDEDATRYRVMKVHPAIYANSTTITIDYVREVSPLDLDADEPAMPVEDRIVLVYGALERAWKRLRNPEASEQSRRDFQEKLAQMAGRVEDSQDSAQLTPSSQYLSRKRGRMSTKSVSSTGSGVGSYTAPSYLKNAVIEGATLTANLTVNSGITIDGVDVSTLSSDFSSHLADTTDAHDASAISFTPAGTISATDVQSAIAEVASDAAALTALTNGHVFVGNASNVATDVAVTGDIAITNAGVTSIATGVIVNADVNASAAIERTKLASGTASHVVINDGTGVLSSEATLAKSRGGTGADNSSVTFPSTGVIVTEAGTQTLTNKTLTAPDISSIRNTGTLTLPTSTDTLVGRATTDTLTNKTISGSSNTITNVSLTTGVTGTLPVANGGTNSSAALNNNRVMQSSSGAVVEAAAITASRALISDANGIPTHSATTSTELGYVSGVTSAIQTQLNGKASTATTQNEIYLSNGNGHGSTNTKVRRYTNVQANLGSAMTLTQSSTNGDSVTINTAGVYGITVVDYRAAATTAFGISVSSANLTTNISSLTIAQGKRLQIGTAAAGTPTGTATTIYLGVNDVVRVHTNGDVDSTDDSSIFRIVKTS